MRSPEFEHRKPSNLFRLLVLGDSVIFGHINIAQPDLATSLLVSEPLNDGRRLEVLNVSAPAWGPGNLLAWIEKHGLLDADAAVLVLSAHDLEDDRTFAPPDPSIYPQKRPFLALPDWIGRALSPQQRPASLDRGSTGDARRSLPLLLTHIAGAPAGACILIHATASERSEQSRSPVETGLASIGVPKTVSVIRDRGFLNAATDYVDDIHLSLQGQIGLARAIKSCPALARLISD